MQETEFSCVITADKNNDLRLKLLLDGEILFDDTVQTTVQISHKLQDIERQRKLEIMLSGKTLDHTILDQDGNILEDILIRIHDIEFDGINIDQLFYEHARYQHDFNGHGSSTVERFYGSMGCNGTVTLEFSTPIYLWLLENM